MLFMEMCKRLHEEGADVLALIFKLSIASADGFRSVAAAPSLTRKTHSIIQGLF